MEYLSDISGYAALAITTLSLCMKSDRILRGLNIVGCLLWFTHFALIGALAAAFMLGLAAVMITASMLGKDRVSEAAWWVNIALIPAIALAALAGQAEWASLSPVIGGFLINTGIARCRGHVMSLMIAAGEGFWILTGLILGSLPVVAANLINIGALGIRTLWRLHGARRPRDPSST